jgi:hypothetical protein
MILKILISSIGVSTGFVLGWAFSHKDAGLAGISVSLVSIYAYVIYRELDNLKDS